MTVWPGVGLLRPPQVAKPVISPEFPRIPSVNTGAPPEPSKVKSPTRVVGTIPAIKLGVSTVQSGVNGEAPLSLEVVIEITGETTLGAAVTCTVMAP